MINFVGLRWVCVLCGWGMELVLELGKVFHKLGFNFPTIYFKFVCVVVLFFVLES